MKRSTTFSCRVAITVAIALTSLLLMTACTDQQGGKDPALLAKQAIDQAQIKHLESQQAGYAWASTTTTLEAATEAFKADRFPEAIIEAEQAAVLADASLAQAKAEQSAWIDRFPKASEIKTPAPTQ